MLRNEVIEYIKNNGIKKSFIASQIGMNNSNFSLWLHGRLCINSEKEEKLREIIKKNN